MYETELGQVVDDTYWQAIVTQGRWADTAPAPHDDGDELDDTPESQPAQSVDETISDADWHALEASFTRGDVMELQVIGYNKGGVLVEWRDTQGFVPASQLANPSVVTDDSERSEFLAGCVGDTLEVKVIELDRDKNRVIFSERAARWGGSCPDDILETLTPGDVCTGQVSNLCDFGVFVDLGGVDGLIHVSELSWQRIDHPRDILDAGEEIDVYVIDVDRERRRIALSLKRMQPNPWASVNERYEVGQIIESIITNVVDFGAFARVEEGIEGLIHVSELGDGDIPMHPRSVLDEGQEVRTRILNIDPQNQRMGLTMRGVSQTNSAESAESEPAPAESAPADAVIRDNGSTETH